MRAGDLNLLAPGDLVDERFEVQNDVGAGFLGQVYRALDQRTGDIVAIKALRNRFLEMPGVAATASSYPMAPLLRQEIRIHRALAHPGIAKYVSSGDINGSPWLAVEFIAGGFASDLPTPLAAEDAVGRALDLLDALAYVHSRGVVHRDVKPENMGYRSDGSLALVDFGLARHYDPPEPMTITAIMGARFYSAPEVYRSELRDTPLSPRSDVFSAARVLQRLLLAGQPEDPDDLVGLPPSLAAVIRSATAEDPMARPADAAELSALLRGA